MMWFFYVEITHLHRSSKIIITKQTHMIKGTYWHILILLKYTQVSTKNNYTKDYSFFNNKFLQFELILRPPS